MLTPLSADVQPSMLKLDRTPYWIRLYDILIKGRDSTVLKQIGNRFGDVLEMDRSTNTGITISVRMKVLLSLNNPLKWGTWIKLGKAEPTWIPVTYERLSSFCYRCGQLGHTYKDCERYYDRSETETYIEEKNMPYGEWLKPSPMKRTQVSPRRNAKDNEKIGKTSFRNQKNLSM